MRELFVSPEGNFTSFKPTKHRLLSYNTTDHRSVFTWASRVASVLENSQITIDRIFWFYNFNLILDSCIISFGDNWCNRKEFNWIKVQLHDYKSSPKLHTLFEICPGYGPGVFKIQSIFKYVNFTLGCIKYIRLYHIK